MCCSNYRMFKCGVLKVQYIQVEKSKSDGKEQVVHTYHLHTEITGIKNPNTLCENFKANLCVGGEIR